MARIRTIKPELLEDEKTATLDDIEWRLFVSMIMMADDYGNLRAAHAKLAGSAFWGSPKPLDVIAAALARLEAVGLVRAYRVADQVYAHLRGWDKHQRVDKPGKPQCPLPPAELPRESRETPENPRETLAPDRDRDQDLEKDREPPAPARSAGPEAGTVHWLRAIYRGLWEAKYSGAFFGASKGDQTAWENHLTANPEARYRAALVEDVPRLLAAYLADPDPKLAERRHPLAFFPERIAKYRAGPIRAAPSVTKPLDVAAMLAQR